MITAWKRSSNLAKFSLIAQIMGPIIVCVGAFMLHQHNVAKAAKVETPAVSAEEPAAVVVDKMRSCLIFATGANPSAGEADLNRYHRQCWNHALLKGAARGL